MNPIKITKQFNPVCFLPRSHPHYRLTHEQHLMAITLHNGLCDVLQAFPKNNFYKDIGLLLDEDRIAYWHEGRNISEITDLSFGLPVKLKRRENIKCYGEYFTGGVGALMLKVEGEIPIFDVYKKLVTGVKVRKLDFGEVSFITGGTYKTPSIYISNNPSVRFSDRTLETTGRACHRFTISENGGITVKSFMPFWIY